MIRKLMLAVVLGVLVALISISVASADQPVFAGPFTFSSTVLVADCGAFLVLDHFTGVVRFQLLFDKDGAPVRFFLDFSGTDTFTNSVTGKGFTEKFHYRQIVDIDTSTNVGVAVNLTIPGEGAVLQDVGRIIFDLATGEVLFEAGKFEYDISALCAALE
jgi:hypothetical protein